MFLRKYCVISTEISMSETFSHFEEHLNTRDVLYFHDTVTNNIYEHTYRVFRTSRAIIQGIINEVKIKLCSSINRGLQMFLIWTRRFLISATIDPICTKSSGLLSMSIRKSPNPMCFVEIGKDSSIFFSTTGKPFNSNWDHLRNPVYWVQVLFRLTLYISYIYNVYMYICVYRILVSLIYYLSLTHNRNTQWISRKVNRNLRTCADRRGLKF